ncbi:MAG: UDP-N-acetylmuramate dehydrogenase [Bacteroidales bacterium]|nr:UDP-N-acetylmuramate dehydrogenase [Bacteroidales bacterium]MBN2757313.1 UDP-N-acetylmuramate dehydrogenase [Bacteroidales bacterium]
MEIRTNYSVKNLNSFSIDAETKYFIEINSEKDIYDFINTEKFKNEELIILGGGNNILFTKNFSGIILHPNIKSISIEFENSDYAIVKAGAAEDWDSFVEWTVNQNFAGIENLSSIPGTVGASPVQNIGAYGVEVKDLITKIDAFNLETGELKTFSNNECNFSYRNSIFKEKFKNKYLITYVYFKLYKNPEFKIHYGDIKNELLKYKELNLKSLRQAIINIRDSKLPKPEKIPNAGSFFKNPIVNKSKFKKLKAEFPEIVSYKIDEYNFKLAAGWLIDFLGWKGKVIGNAGVHDKQALVLINKNNASGLEIIDLAHEIKKSVFDKFGIDLEFEVNIV